MKSMLLEAINKLCQKSHKNRGVKVLVVDDEGVRGRQTGAYSSRTLDLNFTPTKKL